MLVATKPAEPEDADQFDWSEFPHIRKTGRYLFFGVCALGTSALAYFLARGGLGFNKELANVVATAGLMATFLALRDMSKQWDWVLIQRAKALKAARESVS